MYACINESTGAFDGQSVGYFNVQTSTTRIGARQRVSSSGGGGMI